MASGMTLTSAQSSARGLWSTSRPRNTWCAVNFAVLTAQHCQSSCEEANRASLCRVLACWRCSVPDLCDCGSETHVIPLRIQSQAVSVYNTTPSYPSGTAWEQTSIWS